MLGAAMAALLTVAGIARSAYPKALERRVARRRSFRPDGVIHGAEPIVRERAQSPRAVLVVHGGGDTPQAVRQLADHLYAAGYSVCAPLLAGHGRSLHDLTSVEAEEWHREIAREFAALRSRHRWAGVVGLSMGGAMSVRLAAERSDVGALVLLAPYVAMPRYIRALAATSRFWGWLVPYFPSGGRDSIHDRAAADRALGYGIFTPAALRALRDVADQARAALKRVTCPTLIVQSRGDNRVAPATAQQALSALGATVKRLVWIEGAGHVITVDFGHDRVFHLVTEWLDQHSASETP